MAIGNGKKKKSYWILMTKRNAKIVQVLHVWALRMGATHVISTILYHGDDLGSRKNMAGHNTLVNFSIEKFENMYLIVTWKSGN